MGIFVPSATLPDGISLENVYISFRSENINIYVGQFTTPIMTPLRGPPVMFTPVPHSFKWRISSHYKIYTSKEAALQNKVSSIRIPMNVDVDHIGDSPYGILYNKLKEQYPGSYDVIEPNQAPPTSKLVISTTTLVSLYNDLTGTIESDGVTITLSEDAFNELSDAVRTLKEEPPAPDIGEDSQLVVDGTLGEQGDASMRSDSE